MTEPLQKIDEMIEEWDWIKAIPIGKAIYRDKAHKEGIPHEGVHLWVIRSEMDKIELLFQHRSRLKKTYPNCLDITVGGHVPFGVNENKIQKESYEEIGIFPAAEDFIDLGYYRYEEKDEVMFHREFQRVHLLVENRPLDQFSFNDGEVDEIYTIPLNKLEELLIKDITFYANGYDGSKIITKKISRRDFHPLLFSPTMKEYMSVVIEGAKELVQKGVVTVKMPSLVL
ncbi:MAG: NUDIX domain-containing protein [Spirochaetota bacterium]|nr:NUDIX domain-containing protein [Spirochaetota bacterium]